MAFAAFRFRVFALERVIRQLVIEILFVQHDNPCFASLVFRMAGAAGLLLDPPVVPLFLRHVLADVLVTVQAQSVLPFPVKPDMAVRTFPFRLGVTPDELARHQHVFQRARLCQARPQPRRHPGQQQEQCNENRFYGSHAAVLDSSFAPTSLISTYAQQRRALLH